MRPDLFLFIEKAFYEVKASDLQLQFRHALDTNCLKLWTVDLEI